MKWVKVAIGAVIAILSIGIVATSVYGMTQEKTVDREVLISFSILSADGQVKGIDVDVKDYIGNNFDYLNENTDNMDLVLYDSEGVELARREVVSFELDLGADHVIYLTDGIDNQLYRFGSDLTIKGNTNTVSFWGGINSEIGDSYELVINAYTIPPQLTGVSATLILLAPLIFAGGVLAYLLNKQNY